jgi:hypothetical protein
MRLRDVTTYLMIMLIMLLFVSYGGVMDYNRSISPGFMRNVFEMWKPDFPQMTYYGLYWNVILGVPYVIFMFYFLRNGGTGFEFMIVLNFTIVYGVFYANGRFREPLMPLLVLWFARRAGNGKL